MIAQRLFWSKWWAHSVKACRIEAYRTFVDLQSDWRDIEDMADKLVGMKILCFVSQFTVCVQRNSWSSCDWCKYPCPLHSPCTVLHSAQCLHSVCVHMWCPLACHLFHIYVWIDAVVLLTFPVYLLPFVNMYAHNLGIMYYCLRSILSKIFIRMSQPLDGDQTDLPPWECFSIDIKSTVDWLFGSL